MSRAILDIEKLEIESLTYVKKLARTKSPAAIDTLVKLLDSDDERIQLAAANSILDRGLGKPAQDVNIAGQQDGNPLRLVINGR
jgi:HEAT repeat protein